MLRLVIIDDEAIVLQGIRAIIARLHMNVEIAGAATDGIQGRAILLQEKPDLVITDIRMPGIDGLTMIEEVKEELPDTDFVLISGYTDFVYAQKAIHLGVKDYLDKPITVEKIRSVIEKSLQRHSRTAEKTEGREAGTSGDAEMAGDEYVINAIILGNSAAFVEQAEKYLTQLNNRTESDSRFKETAYRFLCVIREIFAGSRKQYDESTLISCEEIMLLESREEVTGLVMKQVTHMASLMEADQKGSNHRVISTILSYINENFSRDIGLAELAEQVDMNPAYLSILFKEEMGTSYVKYLTEFRMQKAKKYLAEGYKVSDVSSMTGFNNYRYFCDVFKKYVGKTPGEYRKVN